MISKSVYHVVYLSCPGHTIDLSNERNGFKYQSIYSKQMQAALKIIKANTAVFSSDDLYLLSLYAI